MCERQRENTYVRDIPNGRRIVWKLMEIPGSEPSHIRNLIAA